MPRITRERPNTKDRASLRNMGRAFGEERLRIKPDETEYFSYIEGRMYGRWTQNNGAARFNDYSIDDLIQQPAYIVESILRDEIFVERDLIVNTATDTTHAVVNGLKNDIDDYYIGAEWFNVTTNFRSYITDYVASTNTIVINDEDASMADNDMIYLTNVQGDNKIDAVSFDKVGDGTSGLRKDWIFAKSIYKETSAESLLQELLFEARCIRPRSYNQYKLIALDTEAGSVDTWTNPLKSNGKYLVSCALSYVGNVINDMRINYAYDYGKGTYQKTLFVNKSGYSSELTNGATYQATCLGIYNNYSKMINKYEYNCNWIYDDATAELFFNHLFEWKSKQRLLVNWAGSVKDYIKYEVGDQVKLNLSEMIPSGINDSSKFMIMENPCVPLPGAPIINFKLVEMG